MLLRLTHDVLICLYVEFLEVRETVLLESVCKDLLRFSRQNRFLWLSLLHDLDLDHAPTLPFDQDVSNLSVEDLRLIVVKAIRAFDNWHHKGWPQAKYTRKVVFSKTLLESSKIPSPITQITLSPGGQYMFLNRKIGTLECWDVSSKKRILNYVPFKLSLHHLDDNTLSGHVFFTFTFDKKEQKMVIFAASSYHKASPMSFSRHHFHFSNDYIEAVILVDLRDGTRKVVWRDFLDLGHGDRDLNIDGDYVVCRAPRAASGRLRIFNWRTKQLLTVEDTRITNNGLTHCHIANDFLILFRQDWDKASRPYVVSALHLPRVFGSMFESGENARLTVDFEGIVDFLVDLAIPSASHILSKYRVHSKVISCTFASWKREEDRNLFIRLCIEGDDVKGVKIVTVKVHLASEMQVKPVVSVVNISPCVDLRPSEKIRTAIGMGFRSILRSGRCLVYQCEGLWSSDIDLDKDRLAYRTSFWALASQKRLDSLFEEAEDLETSIKVALTTPNSDGVEDLPISQLELDDSGTVLFFREPTGRYSKEARDEDMEEVCLWYLI